MQEGGVLASLRLHLTSHSFKFFPHSLRILLPLQGEDYVEIPPVLENDHPVWCRLLLLIPIMLIRQVIVERADSVAMWKMRFAKVPAGRKNSLAAHRYSCDRALYGAGRR